MCNRMRIAHFQLTKNKKLPKKTLSSFYIHVITGTKGINSEGNLNLRARMFRQMEREKVSGALFGMQSTKLARKSKRQRKL